MKTVIATTAPTMTWCKANDREITMWHRGTSWYIGIRHGDYSNTILHCGSEQYIRGVWRRRYVKRTVDTRWQS